MAQQISNNRSVYLAVVVNVENIMSERVCGTGEVAKKLGITRWKLTQMIELGKLPDASNQIAGRRLFSDADVEAVTAKYREICQAKAEKELANARLAG